MNSYLLLILMAVTGNLLQKGNVLLVGFSSRGINVDENDPKVWRTVETNRFPVLGVYPTGVMGQEMLSEREDRLRMMFVSMGNPARSYPDSKRIEAGLDKLELLVVIDIYMSETAKHADYVLPGKTGFEAYEFNMFPVAYPEITCMLKHPIIGQIGERKENSLIWYDIVDRMGYIPELPQDLYDAAAKAVREKDRVPFLLKVKKFAEKNPQYAKVVPLIICKAMLKPMGSINRTMLWAATMTSPLVGTGAYERAGHGAGKKHPFLNLIPQIKALSVADQVFQKVDDTPQGITVGYCNPDREAYMKQYIKHPDGKFHFWCKEIDAYMERITPEKEEAELNKDRAEYPLILSAGRHADGGDNTTMRNPETHIYRDPFTVMMNPDDATRFGVAEGENVRVVTKGGQITVPVEISHQAALGYALIPHQFGLEYDGEVYGAGINELTRAEDIDEITGNPFFRYVPCRVEKLSGSVTG